MMVSSRTERLQTAHLTLLPFREDMVSDRYVGWLNDADVVRYSEQRHRAHTRETCLAYVRSIDGVNSHLWAIHEGPAHIGNISAHRDCCNGTADVGILLGARQRHGAGLGSEAWRAVCDWLLATGVRKVTAGAMAANQPMLRVFAKTGMVDEARLKSHFVFGDRLVDAVLVARFRDEAHDE
jgi:RimJ/RimL family protein N-acetyltransferase